MTTATAKQTTVCPKCGGHCTEQPDPAGAYDRCLNCGWNSDRHDDIIEVEGQVEVAAVNGKSPLSCLDCGAHVETNTKGRSPERCPKCRTARKVARTAASRQSRATQPAPAAEGVTADTPAQDPRATTIAYLRAELVTVTNARGVLESALAYLEGGTA